MTSPPPAHLSKPFLIAIDGPAGAGKSTVAMSLASHLGIPYLDTGAMYRAVALLAIRDGLDTPLQKEEAVRLKQLMSDHIIDVEATAGGSKVLLLDGEDVSSEIRTPECSMMASAVSALPDVRQHLVPVQRRLGLLNGGVMEGRDIGTVVFPDAQVKIFLTADPDERANRRHRDLVASAGEMSLEEVRAQQQLRDLQDTSREDSPLQVAKGSVVVDTSGMTLQEVVERLLEEASKKLDRQLDSSRQEAVRSRNHGA